MGIYLAFAFPLLNLLAIALALRFWTAFIEHGQDSIDLVEPLVCLQVFLCWSVVSVTIPCLRPIALKFTTHGTIILGESGSSAPASTTYGSRSVPKASRTRSGATSMRARPEEWELRPDLFMRTTWHDTSVAVTNGDRTSSTSIGSEQLFIRKTVELETSVVEHVDVDDIIPVLAKASL